ncbi:MAG: hypothetical protein GXP27_11980 [Planctomycetes bacterium]|nr:hypothetical protein [Planctomycetota bacterium]
MWSHRTIRKELCRVGLGVFLLMAVPMVRLGAQETAPEFTPPPLSPSLLDFLTGLPIAYNTKLLCTPKLLRPPFAGAPVDSAKGLAAKIKAQQLDAKNRAKAAKFLGTVDCVAYPEAQEQLMKLLQEDPSEKVRLAAAKALKEQFHRGHDPHPGKKKLRRFDTCRGCCPKPEVLNALSERAYGYDDEGCPLEPSPRVREAIAEALNECCECWYAGYTEEVIPQPAEEEAAPRKEEAEPQAAPPAEPVTPKKEEKAPVPPPEDPGRKASKATGAVLRPVPQRGSIPPAPDAVPQSVPTGQNQPKRFRRELDDRRGGTASSNRSAMLVKHETDTTKALPEVACLRGYCPVAMLEHRLIPAKKQFTSVFEGRVFHFSSARAKEAFDRDPQRFAPVLGGIDIVILRKTGQRVTGNCFVPYNGRPYWFATKKNRDLFLANPERYVSP